MYVDQKIQLYILMHSILSRDVWLDNVKNLRVYPVIYCQHLRHILLDDLRYVACSALIWDETAKVFWNRDNFIQNFHFGRYFVGYMVGNHILQFCWHVAVKLNFQSK